MSLKNSDMMDSIPVMRTYAVVNSIHSIINSKSLLFKEPNKIHPQSISERLECPSYFCFIFLPLHPQQYQLTIMGNREWSICCNNDAMFYIIICPLTRPSSSAAVGRPTLFSMCITNPSNPSTVAATDQPPTHHSWCNIQPQSHLLP